MVRGLGRCCCGTVCDPDYGLSDGPHSGTLTATQSVEDDVFLRISPGNGDVRLTVNVDSWTPPSNTYFTARFLIMFGTPGTASINTFMSLTWERGVISGVSRTRIWRQFNVPFGQTYSVTTLHPYSYVPTEFLGEWRADLVENSGFIDVTMSAPFFSGWTATNPVPVTPPICTSEVTVRLTAFTFTPPLFPTSLVYSDLLLNTE